MKPVSIQLTSGQIFFIVLCLIAAGFLDFYLGARFGPQLFWNIKVDQARGQSLLPEHLSEAEIKALLAEESPAPLTFHRVLEKKSVEAPPVVRKIKAKPSPASIIEKELSRPRFYSLQVGSFSSKRKAERLVKKIRKSGYTAFVSEDQIPNKGKWYRVKVGKYASQETAELGKGNFYKVFRIKGTVVEY